MILARIFLEYAEIKIKFIYVNEFIVFCKKYSRRAGRAKRNPPINVYSPQNSEKMVSLCRMPRYDPLNPAGCQP